MSTKNPIELARPARKELKGKVPMSSIYANCSSRGAFPSLVSAQSSIRMLYLHCACEDRIDQEAVEHL